MNIYCLAAVAGFASTAGSAAAVPRKYLKRDIYEFYTF